MIVVGGEQIPHPAGDCGFDIDPPTYPAAMSITAASAVDRAGRAEPPVVI